ncbi:MAG: PqqD family protein [Deltaproteobacteria bacterium]|nr:PqqD family protein [Deltaproteobacteria bacterium]
MAEKVAPTVLSEDSIVVAATQAVSRATGDETVLLQLESGRYFSLDAIGSVIWHQLERPQCVAELRDRIVARYEVDKARCERDLLALLRELSAARLINVTNTPSGGAHE